MADHIISFNLLLLCLLFFFSFSSADDAIILKACNASLDPPTCRVLLSGHVPSNATTALQVIQSALSVVATKLQVARDMINEVQRVSAHNLNWTNAATSCIESIHYSNYRLKRVSSALKKSKSKLKDARAWLSAALGYQYNCWSGLRYTGANKTLSGTNATDFFNSTLMPITSSALGMLFNCDVQGPTFLNWGPAKTERDDFWERVISGSRPPGWTVGVPEGLKVNATVCNSGCTYTTVQDAVNAAPKNLKRGLRFVILIKAGIYEETVRVPLNKTNVVLWGDGMGKTVIRGSRSVGLQVGMTTYNSAVVEVVGDGFMACNLTIQNATGVCANQAVAFRSDSDKSVVQNCEFIGNQDTLFAGSLRQLYKCCVIQGNIDFIFGNSAAVFEDCTILVAPRLSLSHPEKGETNTVTAHGRIDPAQTTGFVFWNSVVNGTKKYMDLYDKNPKVHKNYLGRPWKEYSRTVFIGCTLEALISPEGWMPWQGNFALNTLYYGELNNSGLGSSRTQRVNWSSLIPTGHVDSYSAQNFIQAYEYNY